MGNIVLIIVTENDAYGRALGQAILHICSQIVVHLVNKEEFFLIRKYADSSGLSSFIDEADLILWDGEEAEAGYGGRFVLLSDNPAMAVKKFSEKKFCIYKYSNAQCVVSGLFEIYSFLTGKRAAHIKRGQVRMLAFSSWSGGTGCTTVAMSVAQELCRFRGNRVLYLSFEEMESTGEFMESPAGIRGAGVYLYHLFKPDSLKRVSDDELNGDYPMMDSYMIRDSFGVEAFAPTSGRNPLRSLTAEEYEVFMASVTDSGRYDVIVMDLGNSMSCIDLSCLEIAEKVCFVSDSRSSVRETQYLQHLMYRCGEEVMKKLIRTENMTDNVHSETADCDDVPMMETVARIARSSTAIQGGRTKRIFLDGEFGRSIQELTDKMTGSA